MPDIAELIQAHITAMNNLTASIQAQTQAIGELVDSVYSMIDNSPEQAEDVEQDHDQAPCYLDGRKVS